MAINNWVRNQIRYAPGYGAIQGAAATLKARRGNDVDRASLLIALDRAAGIPARYAYGTIEVPAAPLGQGWLGRRAIAGAIGSFYSLTRSDAWGDLPIGTNFAKESPRFIDGHTNCIP